MKHNPPLPPSSTTTTLPPFDPLAEESVIASLMVDEGAADRIAGLVSERDFFRDSNRWAYQACIALWRRGEAVNQVTVAHELSRAGRLEDVGGLAYLARLTSELPTPVGCESYAKLVHGDGVCRRVITFGSDLVRRAYRGEHDIDAVLASAADELARLWEDARVGDKP